MVDDINLEDPGSNLLIKFADDFTLSARVKTTGDSAVGEVRNTKDERSIKGWFLACPKHGKWLCVAEQ